MMNFNISTYTIIFVLTVFFSINAYFQLLPISSEIQPIGAFFACIGILFIRRIYFNEFIILFFLLCFLLWSFIRVELINYPVDSSEILPTFFAILAPLVTYSFLLQSKSNDLDLYFKVFYFSFILWVLVGLFQSFFPKFLYVTGIDFVFQKLISRYSSEAIGGDSGRGIRFLASEPSYAAHVLFLFFSFLILSIKHHLIEIKKGIFYILLFLLVAVNNKSTTLFGLLGFNLLVYFFLVFFVKNTIKHMLLFSFLIGFFSFSFCFFSPDESRFFIAINRIIELLNHGSLIDAIMSVSGQRTASVYVGYLTLLNNLSYYYFGSWKSFFEYNALLTGVNIWNISYFSDVTSNVKPYSLISTVVFDFGWLGFLLSLCIVHRPLCFLFYAIKNGWILEFSIVLTTLFAILFNSPLSISIYFLLICFVFLISGYSDFINKSKD